MPDGLVYVLADEADGKLIRLEPLESDSTASHKATDENRVSPEALLRYRS